MPPRLRLYLAAMMAGGLAFTAALHTAARRFEGADYDPARWVSDGLALKQRIAARATRPQIIVLAGSNALYGFSAERLEARLGVPATNAAMHAGLGLDYILAYGKRLARPGDLVVLPLEYELYGKALRDPAERLQALLHDRAYYDALGLGDQLALLGGLTANEWRGLVRASVRADPRNPKDLQASTLNAHGDETNNAASAPVAPSPTRAHLEVTRAAVAAIRAFALALRASGAEVVLAYPNLHVEAFRPGVSDDFLAEMHEAARAAGVKLIGSASAAAFPTAHHYNTRYHQTAEGQAASTDRLIRELRDAGVALPSKQR